MSGPSLEHRSQICHRKTHSIVYRIASQLKIGGLEDELQCWSCYLVIQVFGALSHLNTKMLVFHFHDLNNLSSDMEAARHI